MIRLVRIRTLAIAVAMLLLGTLTLLLAVLVEQSVPNSFGCGPVHAFDADGVEVPILGRDCVGW